MRTGARFIRRQAPAGSRRGKELPQAAAATATSREGFAAGDAQWGLKGSASRGGGGVRHRDLTCGTPLASYSP
jgi:hypothetical protein